MKKYSMRSIPVAAAMMAALIFGVQVGAQTPGNPTPPGDTNRLDAASPDPKGGTPKRAAADPNNPSPNPVSKSATMTPGTTTALDNVNPSPPGGKAKSAEERAAAKMAKEDKKNAVDPKRAERKSKTKPPADDTDSKKAGAG